MGEMSRTKLKLLCLLAVCGLFLAGCYRQSEDSFEQVDSQEVEVILSPTGLATVALVLGGTDGAPLQPLGIAATATLHFITPQPPPGQVLQPTVFVPSATPAPAAAAATSSEPTATLSVFLPTATPFVPDELSADDECVHEVLGGDTLYGLAIRYGVYVADFELLNELDSSDIFPGDLLLIPGCEPGTEPSPSEPEESAADSEAPPAGGPRIHVVASGDTIGHLSVLYDISIADIVAYNSSLSDPDVLSVGQEILIPPES